VRGQLIAEERLGEHRGQRGLHGPAAARAIPPFQPIEQRLRARGGDI
jgi:hypothetical protein